MGERTSDTDGSSSVEPGEAGDAREPARDRGWPQRIRRWAFELAVFVVILFAIRSWQQWSLARGVAPPLRGADLRGASVAEHDGPYAVHFMAEWCGVCAAEEPNIAELARGHRVVVVVTQSGSVDAVRRWIAEETHLDAARVIADPDGRVAAEWGVHSFPTTFFVAANGTIRFAEVGYTTLIGMQVRAFLASF